MNYVQLLMLEGCLGFLVFKKLPHVLFSKYIHHAERQYARTAYWYPAHWLGR